MLETTFLPELPPNAMVILKNGWITKKYGKNTTWIVLERQWGDYYLMHSEKHKRSLKIRSIDVKEMKCIFDIGTFKIT